MTRVNLLPSKAKLGLSRLGFVRRFRAAAVVGLVIFVFWAGAVLAANVYLSKKAENTALAVAANENRMAEFLPKLNLQSRSRARIKYVSKVIVGQVGLPFEIEDLYSFLGKGARIKTFDYKSGEATVTVEAPELGSLAELEEEVGRLNQAGGKPKYKLIDAKSILIDGQGTVKITLKIIPTDAKLK